MSMRVCACVSVDCEPEPEPEPKAKAKAKAKPKPKPKPNLSLGLGGTCSNVWPSSATKSASLSMSDCTAPPGGLTAWHVREAAGKGWSEAHHRDRRADIRQ